MTAAPTLPEWAVWVQALGPTAMSAVTGLVAIAVAIVAYRQWKTAREKLVLDLFDRRMQIYANVNAFPDLLLQESISIPADKLAFYEIREKANQAIRESHFLFPSHVTEELSQIADESGRIADAMCGLSNTVWGPEHDERLSLLLIRRGELRTVLAPYMRMQQSL